MITALDIREQTQSDVLDYQQLMSCLNGYAKPRDRISALLADGSLIRLRKGLYVLGERYRRDPIRREYLANLIYGPSYVSLDYALSHYGLIPEHVEEVTSMTTGTSRRFDTPFGVFSYRFLPPQRYAPGVHWAGEDEARCLMASPEKALVDKVWADKRFSAASLKDVNAYLFDDLRLDEARTATLDRTVLRIINQAFSSRKIDRVLRCLAQRALRAR